MKRLILSLLDRPFPGTLIGRLGGFLYHRPTIMGLTNPFHVSHYIIERDGARYLAPTTSYLALKSATHQIVRFKPGVFEPEISYLIESLVGAEDVVIDVGANVGVHTVAFARAAHKGRVLAFEPVAEMLERASLNCALNGITNIALINCALGEVSGEIEINVNVAGDGMEGTSSLLKTVHVERNPENYRPRKVPVRRLDDVIEEMAPKGRISFIKIDTEGFEPMVLKGAVDTIRRHRPAMVVETHSRRLALVGLSFRWYLDAFPDYHALIVHAVTPANPYLRLEPLIAEPPEIAVNLLLLPRRPGTSA